MHLNRLKLAIKYRQKKVLSILLMTFRLSLHTMSMNYLAVVSNGHAQSGRVLMLLLNSRKEATILLILVDIKDVDDLQQHSADQMSAAVAAAGRW